MKDLEKFLRCLDELEASREEVEVAPGKVFTFGRPSSSWLMSTFKIDRETAVKAFEAWKEKRSLKEQP